MTIPKHLVIFPDGNGRWAKQKGLPEIFGYKKGYENMVKFCLACNKRGIKTLTIFGFTTENWLRGSKGVNFLLKLLEKKLISDLKKYAKREDVQKLGVHVRVIGQKEKLPESLRRIIEHIEEMTKNNSSLFLNLAISYGGKWDILQAVKRIIKDKIPAEKIEENLFESYLSTAGLPNPDFIIRTGGDMRLSNFALWQSARSELYFTPKMWPAFTEKDLDQALAEFSRRKS